MADTLEKKEEAAKGGRKSETVGTLRKNCPSCGAPIESFQTRCPSCGHELNQAEVSEHFQRFVEAFKNCLQYEDQYPIIIDQPTNTENATLCLSEVGQTTSYFRKDGDLVNKGDVLFYYYGWATNGVDTPLYAPGAGVIHYEKEVKQAVLGVLNK
jgi:endogenous inhibitor of DNA gyrase (YacG/DUF329 family)